MASRHRSRLTYLLIGVVLVGCSVPDSAVTTSSVTSVTTSPSTSTSTSSTTSSTTSTTLPATTTTLELPEFNGEVMVPEGDGPFPAVVLVHGGAWLFGDISAMRPLARHLTDAGFLTVNARYQLATGGTPGFPGAVDDIACAVRYAAAHPDSDGTVVILGHSAGAHIGAIVALTGDLYGQTCPVPGTGLPDRFVGMAGPYNIHTLGIFASPFFGGSSQALPELWDAGNPYRLAALHPAPNSLLIHAELDSIVPAPFADDFLRAILDSGGSANLEVITGAHHNDLMLALLTGNLIVDWLRNN